MAQNTRLLIISFDALGDVFFDEMLTRPNFAALAARSRVNRGVRSVFVSNTYPVHTSVATGLLPREHGLVRNTEAFPKKRPQWNYLESAIKAETIWQQAAKAGKSVAAVLWPVTGGSSSIRWHIPETLAQPGENQILVNLKHGSAGTQVSALLRFGHLFKSAGQPHLDNFAAACMADILRRKKPDLSLMHLTGFDAACHKFGLRSEEAVAAMDALDEHLGMLLSAAESAKIENIILFSDHAQLPAEKPFLPNDILVKLGLLQKSKDGDYQAGESGCFFESAGGSAFFHAGSLSDSETDKVKSAVFGLPGFARFLHRDEMEECGIGQEGGVPFGFCVSPGYGLHSYETGEKATHGFPLDYPDYKVFYMQSGPGVVPEQREGGSLLDIAPLARECLGC
jgi:hypothetical protein